MSDLPGNFGLDAVRTLARVADPTPASNHRPFWSSWFESLAGSRPVLVPRRPGDDESDPTATHEFRSEGDLRIGARLVLPRDAQGRALPVRGGVVTSHGYHVAEALDAAAERWAPVVERGLAVLLIRVRGYPGSQRNIGDLTKPDHLGGGWITRGLASPSTGTEGDSHWLVPKAVADLANGCRALRNALLRRTDDDGAGILIDAEPAPRLGRPMLALHGESLGGGLAVIAAAMLSGRVPLDPLIDRLVVGLPSLGDWRWRLEQEPGGSGREVAELLARNQELAERIRHRLRLADAAVHAPRVRSPALVKLAERDDAVPAPSQAAVFNALGCDPGRRWRFVVPFGHFDGGIRNARRHALFERAVADFLDPADLPEHAMRRWESVLSAGERGPDGERPTLADPPVGDEPEVSLPAPAESLFPGAPAPDRRDAVLIEAYARAGRTLDSLPYTPEFDAIFEEAGTAGLASARDAFHRLHNLRKAGRLPRLGRAPDQPPSIGPEEEEALRGLVVELAGSLGQRDRLPYTPGFDALAERFEASTGRSLSRHDLWRVIAKLAK